MTAIYSALFAAAGLSVVHTRTVPTRPARTAAIPSGLASPVVAALARRFAGGLYRHQAEALSGLIGGQNVVLSTPTGSGKSLPMQAHAVSRALAGEKTLALYPAKALMQDQLQSWRAWQALGVRVGVVSGAVPVSQREDVLAKSDIVLATPDVVHAWAMRQLSQPVVRDFMASVGLLVLDETHVYDGAFGTNVAYLMRRLRLACGDPQIVASTATVHEPTDFLHDLCGVSFVGVDDDGSASTSRTMVALRPGGAATTAVRDLVVQLATQTDARFLVFVDSRQGVEKLTCALHDALASSSGLGVDDVLPYRSGYEDTDREDIQRALTDGSLRGVVSTSALELGIDIGDIDVVVCAGVPATRTSWWQRIGRAGRGRRPGLALTVDVDDRLHSSADWDAWVDGAIEPNWLYLDNPVMQYAHALCAARELEALGHNGVPRFGGLPRAFRDHVRDELSGGGHLPAELYTLKQQAGASPWHAFALRAAPEQRFDIVVGGGRGQRIGTMTRGQVLREAYPGACYLHRAKAYRVVSVRERHGQVVVKRDRRRATSPDASTLVFPSFDVISSPAWVTADVCVIETDVQVSTRVTGVREKVQGGYVTRAYGPKSVESRTPLMRHVATTGLCIIAPEAGPLPVLNTLAHDLLELATEQLGLHRVDLGIGRVYARQGALGLRGPLKGVCVYDDTPGSLRLTGRIRDALEPLLQDRIQQGGDPDVLDAARYLLAIVKAPATTPTAGQSAQDLIGEQPDGRWVLIPPGQKGLHLGPTVQAEVTVRDVRYTPRGMMYEIASDEPGVTHLVPAVSVQPIPGVSDLALYDPMRGAWVDAEAAE